MNIIQSLKKISFLSSRSWINTILDGPDIFVMSGGCGEASTHVAVGIHSGGLQQQADL